MKLVIVESPAKCAKIQGFLGPGYKVVASMGHIRALEETLDAVGLTNDFEPRFAFLSSKAAAQAHIKDAAKGATQVFLAADDDREGEAIAYSVALLLKLPPQTTPRIVFHEITETAVTNAIRNPRTLNMDRICAQQARSMLDMMIGFTLSPVLWAHVARGLSAGRCQTPALKLLADRETTIQTFQSTSSWTVAGQWATASEKPPPFQAHLQDELEDEDSALNYLDLRKHNKEATVVSNVIRPWSATAPQPLITSTLQQQASALYGFSPKTTMRLAQTLYESGHITYMRTDKAVLSNEAVQEARAWVVAQFGEAYVATDPIPKKNLKKKATATATATAVGEGEVKAQEAHEAIRPTHMDAVVAGEDAQQRKVYALIRNRAIQSVMSPATGETCTVTIHATEETEEDRLPWKATWKRTLFLGWRRIEATVASLEDEEGGEGEEETAWDQSAALVPGTRLAWATLQAKPKETRPPGRMTEAILVRELEQRGIGRPSTFSSLLATIQDRGYAEIRDIPGKEVDVKTYTLDASNTVTSSVVKRKVGQETKKLMPTELGLQSLTFLERHFAHLFDYTFTGQMETRLDRIEQGLEPWKQVLRDTWATYKETYDTLLRTAPDKADRVKTLGSDGLKAVMTKKGPLLLKEGTPGDTTFYGWPVDVPFSDITEARARAHMATHLCGEQIGVWKDQPVLKKTGKFGPYVQVGDSLHLSVTVADTWETIQAKLETHGALKTFKEYEVRSGPYGPYMVKTTLKKRQFVSLPKGITVDTLTEAEVAALYKAGLETKKRGRPAYKTLK